MRYLRIALVLTALLGLFPHVHAADTATPTVEQHDAKTDAKGETIPVVLVPRREAVLSAQVASPVETLVKEMGDSIRKGEPLLTLVSTLFLARPERAKADLDATNTELEAVERLYQDRSKSLVDLMNARRSAAGAKANLALAQHEFDACTVRAPFDGRVVKVHVKEHELVHEGQRLVTLVDDSLLRAQLLAPGSLYRALTVGAVFPVLLDGNPAQARITNISPIIDAASNTVEVFAEIDNRDGKLRSGMIGEIRAADLPSSGTPSP